MFEKSLYPGSGVRRHAFVWGGMLAVACLGVSAVVCGEDAELAAMPALAAKLDSPSFAERTQAQRTLAGLVERSPEGAEELIETAQPGAAVRIVHLLEAVFLRHDSELGGRAEQALERIARSEREVSVQARGALIRNARIRESRARRAIEHLGGELVYIHPEYERVSRALPAAEPLAPLTGVGFGEPAVLYAVWLHQDWQGGNDALWHIERLQHCRDLTLYSIQGNGVDSNRLFQLAAFVPGLDFVERGPCLGIQGAPFGDGCDVGAVLPGSAADKGGLQTHDRVLMLNDGFIRSFQHLVESLKAFQIGETITLTVARPGDGILRLKIRLTSWREVDRSNGEVEAPLPFGGPFAPTRTVPPPVPKSRRLVQESLL